jgi:NOL1/NOP2/fmu family ribosome biogenesis protein
LPESNGSPERLRSRTSPGDVQANESPRDTRADESPRGTLLQFYGSVFGVATEDLAGLDVTEKDGEIWAAAAPTPYRVRTRRPAGLRALRRMPDGPKPTSTFLSCLGPRIHASRVDVDLESLRALLLGRRLGVDLPNSYVALAYDGLVLGCGRVQRSELHALIPTGRRRELLEVLEDRPPPKGPKL